MDLGNPIGLIEGMSELNGFMMIPAVSVSFILANAKAITLSLDYNYQSWSVILKIVYTI